MNKTITIEKKINTLLIDEEASLKIINNLQRRNVQNSNIRVFNSKGSRDIELELAFFNESCNFKTISDIELFFKANLNEKFGIVINDFNELIEDLDDKFIIWQKKELDNLFYKGNRCLIDFVLFLGNYGYTPFGIHNDIGDYM